MAMLDRHATAACIHQDVAVRAPFSRELQPGSDEGKAQFRGAVICPAAACITVSART